MIELLNKYRAAKESSEEAATDLGRAFGKAFGIAYPNDLEVQVARTDNIIRSEQLTIDDLNVQVLGRRTWFAEVFGDVFRRNPSNRKWSVGIRFPSDSKVSVDGSEVELHEASFVLGFIDGLRQSRSSANQERNGTPSLVASR